MQKVSMEIRTRKAKGATQLSKELQWLIEKVAEKPEKYLPKLQRFARTYDGQITLLIDKKEISLRKFVEVYEKSIKGGMPGKLPLANARGFAP